MHDNTVFVQYNLEGGAEDKLRETCDIIFHLNVTRVKHEDQMELVTYCRSKTRDVLT